MLERIGAVAYKLQLPEDCLVHPMFHVSQLKPFTPNYSPVFKDLSPVSDLTVETPKPVEVLDRRLVKRGNSATQQILVKWSTLPTECAEPVSSSSDLGSGIFSRGECHITMLKG